MIGNLRDDRGSGSVLALAVIVAVLSVCAFLLTLASALGLKHSLQATAESAALAAADVASGAIAGYPCDRAAQAAALGGVSLDSCAVAADTVTVRVSRTVFGFEVGAHARAGPSLDSSLNAERPGTQTTPQLGIARLRVCMVCLMGRRVFQ